MTMLNSLKTGFYRTLRSWMGILIVWLVLFILVSFTTIPLRSGLKSAFDNSMITEKLTSGFNLEAYMDLGPALKTLIASAFSGFLFVFLVGFIVNAFLTGGLFGSLRRDRLRFSSGNFFRDGAKNFWPFLIINAIITLLIFFLLMIIIVIPSAIITGSETMSEKGAFITGTAAIAFYLILLPVFLIAADYARAKKASDDSFTWYHSLGFGFSLTFKKLRKSYIMMLFLFIYQAILVVLILEILPEWKPVSNGGVLLLLIVSQLFLYARLFLKTWRYGSFTAMMDESEPHRINNEL